MKQFLIVGNIGAVVYKNVFSLFKSNVVKYRPQCIHKFLNGAAAATWYTTFTVPELPFLELTRTYNPVDYPKYDNYDAIEVSRTMNIPYDYPGVMGVPITFLDKYCPDQFDIITIACASSWSTYPETLKTLGFNPNIKYGGGLGAAVLNEKGKYVRLMIKRKMN